MWTPFVVIFFLIFVIFAISACKFAKKFRKKHSDLYQSVIIVLSTFLGLFCAIQSENFRISKEENQKEENALSLMLESIEKNRIISKDFIKDLSDKKMKLKRLIEHVNLSRPYSNHLDKSFAIPGDDFNSRFSYAEFENLQNLGLHIIKSNSLRLNIIKTYSQDLNLIKNREDSFKDLYPNFQSFKWKYFKTIGKSGTFEATPRKYEELLENSEFIGLYTFYYQAIESLEKDHKKYNTFLDTLRNQTMNYLKEEYPNNELLQR